MVDSKVLRSYLLDITRPDTLYSVGSFHSVDLHTEQVALLQAI